MRLGSTLSYKNYKCTCITLQTQFSFENKSNYKHKVILQFTPLNSLNVRTNTYTYVEKTKCSWVFLLFFFKIELISEWLMNSSYLSSLRFSNHHYNFFHWVKDTFPRMPIYPFAMICVPILPVKIWPVACVIPPTSAPNWSTVTTWIIIVTVVRSEEHPAMVLQAVSWNSNEQWTGIKVFSLMIVSCTTTLIMNLKAFEYIANDINVEKNSSTYTTKSTYIYYCEHEIFSLSDTLYM